MIIGILGIIIGVLVLGAGIYSDCGIYVLHRQRRRFYSGKLRKSRFAFAA